MLFGRKMLDHQELEEDNLIYKLSPACGVSKVSADDDFKKNVRKMHINCT